MEVYRGYEENISRLVTADELISENQSVTTQNRVEISGYLPPENKIYKGESDSDGPYIEVERQYYDYLDFLYDSEVGTKFRGTTYYKIKRWSQKEDRYLTVLVKKYNNNWKKIAEKLQEKRDKNVEIKNESDCSTRWTTLKRQQRYEWSDQANDLLLRLVTTKGKKWKIFEKYFDGCDKYNIKKQYKKLQKEGRLPTGLSKCLSLNFS